MTPTKPRKHRGKEAGSNSQRGVKPRTVPLQRSAARQKREHEWQMQRDEMPSVYTGQTGSTARRRSDQSKIGRMVRQEDSVPNFGVIKHFVFGASTCGALVMRRRISSDVVVKPGSSYERGPSVRRNLSTQTDRLRALRSTNGFGGARSAQSRIIAAGFGFVVSTDSSVMTEHLVARTHAHFSECRALDHRSSHAPAFGSSLGCGALLRILKVIHPQHVSSTTLWCA